MKMEHGAFTLIELLVVIAVITALMAISVPVLNRARQAGLETVCKSNLRQMALILQTYLNDQEGAYPKARTIYHSDISFDLLRWPGYLSCCRWHDRRMAQDSALLREHPELRGSLSPYIEDPQVLVCTVGKSANELRGCWNACPPIPTRPPCEHDGTIPVQTQYTYTMNANLCTSLTTGSGSADGDGIDKRTLREWRIWRPTHVTRSPSEVFLFGEQNSWAINPEGKQPLDTEPHWPAPYRLSGKFYKNRIPHGFRGTLRLGGLDIHETYTIDFEGPSLEEKAVLGDCFATYHRPPAQDLNAGHSYIVMLDGHLEKVTAADQLRQTRMVPSVDPGHFLPGGNVTLAWPIDIPPPGGWDRQ